MNISCLKFWISTQWLIHCTFFFLLRQLYLILAQLTLMMVSRSISISVVWRRKILLDCWCSHDVSKATFTCMSSRVLMAVRKCSFDLLQVTSFWRASELSVNWKIRFKIQQECNMSMVKEWTSVFITQFAAALIDVSIYLKHSRVDLLILAVKDVLDELHVICPHSHLEEAENGTVSNVDF